MKDNMIRAIKLLSSFTVIALILLGTFAVPGRATSAKYHYHSLGDMHCETVERNGVKRVTYDLYSGSIVPVTAIKTSTLNGFNAEYVYSFEDTSSLTVDITLLGKYGGYTTPLDVRDLRTYDSIKLDFDIICQGSFQVSKTVTYYTRLCIACLDDNMEYLTTIHVGQATAIWSGVQYQFTKDIICDLNLTDNVSYIIPYIVINVHRPVFQVGDVVGFTVASGHLTATKSTFVAHVTDGIGTIVNWIGTIVSSLFGASGALNGLLPLLAVCVAVPALLFGIKAIRAFIWGL